MEAEVIVEEAVSLVRQQQRMQQALIQPPDDVTELEHQERAAKDKA